MKSVPIAEPDAGILRVGESTFASGLLGESNAKQSLAKLDGFSVLYVDLDNLATDLGFDFIHQLHRFNDAQNAARLDRVACLDKRLGVRIRRAVESSDNRRPHVQETFIFIWTVQELREHRQWRLRMGAAAGGYPVGKA